MRLPVRPLFVGIAGAMLSLCLWRLAVYDRPISHDSGPLRFVRWLLLEGPISQAILYLLPWFVVGAFAKRSPIITASLAGFVAETTRHALFVHGTIDGPQLLESALRFGSAGAIYGAAAGALGASVLAANNSFKPKPLRGSA